MRLAPTLAIAMAIQVMASTAAAQSPDEINTERVLHHVRMLADTIGPRPAGSKQAKRTAEYVYGELRLVGLRPDRIPVGTIDAPAVQVGSMRFMKAVKVHYQDANIVVRIKPAKPDSGRAILLMAHYDSVPGAPGAIDNATSVGILLELARVLARAPPPRTIILAFTAAEEVRLAGARRLAKDLGDEVGLAVALDLIGLSDTVTLNGLSSLLGFRWLELLAALAHKANIPIRAPMPHRVVSRLLPQLERSDHGAFTERGIPAFHLYNRVTYLAYHTPWDKTTNVRRGSIDSVAAFVTELTRFHGPLPSAGGDQGFWLPFSDKPMVIRALTAQIIELILALFVIFTLVTIIRARTSAGKGLGFAIVVPAYIAGWLVATIILQFGESLAVHPNPWIHAPIRYMMASQIIAAATSIGLGWLVITRFPLIGRNRYLIGAIALPLLTGFALLALGAHELAWIPMVAAAALAAMHWTRAKWAALVWLCIATLPTLVLLGPAFLREATFHGFLSSAIPLSLLAGVLLLYPTLGALYVARRWPNQQWPEYASTRVIKATLVGSAVAATLVLLVPTPPCEPSIYQAYGISCEIVPRHE